MTAPEIKQKAKESSEKAWSDFSLHNEPRPEAHMGALCEIFEQPGRYEMKISLPPGLELDHSDVRAELRGNSLTLHVLKRSLAS